MTVEGADLIYLAAGFAERVAAGDWDSALEWAQSADAVSRGRSSWRIAQTASVGPSRGPAATA